MFECKGVFVDPSISWFVALMIHADGVNGSTTFTDSARGRAITANGAAQVNTAISKFGGGAVDFTGADADYLSVATPDALDGDFTIDFWIYPRALTFEPFASDASHITSPRFKVVAVAGSTQWNPGGATNINGTELTLNIWTHIEIGRSGTTTKFFINGVSQGVPATGELPIFIPLDFRIGTAGNSGWTLNGLVDEFRVVKNYCVHTSDFTPPSSPYNI